MLNWKKYQAKEVLSGNDENGNRLISLFAKEYKKITGDDICPSCHDFSEKFKKFINRIEAMSKSENKNSGFVLKPMYDNITLFGSNKYYNNATLTDDLALELLEKHPRGKELFQSVPTNLKELKKENKPEVDAVGFIDLFGKKFSVNEAKDLFKSAGIDSRATTITGLKNSLEKISSEEKSALQDLVNPVDSELDLVIEE